MSLQINSLPRGPLINALSWPDQLIIMLTAIIMASSVVWFDVTSESFISSHNGNVK